MDHIEELITKYVDNQASEKEVRQVEKLIASDENLRKTVAGQIQVRRMLSEISNDSCHSNVKSIVLNKLNKTERKKTTVHSFIFRSAAGMVLAFGLLYLVTSVVLRDPPDKTNIANGQMPKTLSYFAEPANLDVTQDFQVFSSRLATQDSAFGNADDFSILTATLNLDVKVMRDTEKLLTQALYNRAMLSSLSLDRQAGKSVYSITEDKKDIEVLLSDITFLIESADNQFELQNFSVGKSVIVSNIKSSQACELLNTSGWYDVKRLAAVYDVQNNFQIQQFGSRGSDIVTIMPAIASTPTEAVNVVVSPMTLTITIAQN